MKKLGYKHNLPIKIFGINSIPSFQIISQNSLKYKTFITQEMLKKIFFIKYSVRLYCSQQQNNEKIYL